MVNSKRKQQALNGGVSGPGAGGLTAAAVLVGTKKIKISKGSTMNWGGNSKYGSYRTIGGPLSLSLKLGNCVGCKPGNSTTGTKN